MCSKPKISEAEWMVMKVLWDRSQATANEVVEALSASQSWKPKTVKTLINRLVGKKALGFSKNGREYLYRPLITEAECVLAETQSFLGRAGAGALKPMLAAFVETHELTAEEIAELKQILDRKGKQQ